MVVVAGVAASSFGASSQQAPRISLSAGEIRWFGPGQLQTGQLIRCGADHDVTAKVPTLPANGSVGIDATAGLSQTALQIQRKSNGATQITCGAAAPAPRPGELPYVIGPNGVGLIRGPNRLDVLTRVFGPATLRAARSHSERCTARWKRVGLVATFDRATCAPEAVMVGAVVTGRSWSTLTGTRIGDPVGRMLWVQPTVTLASRSGRTSVWRIGPARPAPTPSLYATTAGNRVTTLSLAR